MPEPQDLLIFNGVRAESGEYLLPPMSAEELSHLALGERISPEHLQELRFKERLVREARYALEEGLDAKDLAEAGWGVIFAFDAQPAVREALEPLLALRRGQAGDLFHEYSGPDGYRTGESKNAFLARHGASPGPAKPHQVPYYLLIAGDPEAIPFRFQYELDVQRAVGRLCFDTPEEYAAYARSVVAAESGAVKLDRRAAFFATQNPNDSATDLAARLLAAPLADQMSSSQPGWMVDQILAAEATKQRLLALLTAERPPAFLFTASHGMGFDNGSPLQIAHQGALLCQDWPGPRQWRQAVPQTFYLAGDDVPGDAKVHGMIAFHFACYGAGTPRLDDYSQGAGGERPAIAPRSFVAALPRRLLGHPQGGALAVVGHVERAWGSSFLWDRTGPQLGAFESCFKRLAEGHPIGSALEFFNQRYAELATMLTGELEDVRFGKVADPLLLGDLWTAQNDARAYALLGDPAVRLPLSAAEK
jgi:hypothetical protein